MKLNIFLSKASRSRGRSNLHSSKIEIKQDLCPRRPQFQNVTKSQILGTICSMGLVMKFVVFLSEAGLNMKYLCNQ